MNRSARSPRPGRRARRPLTLAASLAVPLALALTLSACGSEDDGAEGGAEGGSDGGNAETHTVETANGPVEVPRDPQRVVVLDTGELDTALTLGITPVGAVHAVEENDFLGYFPAEEQEGITDVGAITQPNLELIHELDPDVIIGSNIRDADRYDELSEIAPTVFAEDTGDTWKENFLLFADALDRADEAQQIVADYDAHVAEVVESLGGAEAVAEQEVSVLRFIDGADARLYGPQSFIGTVLTDLGVGRPAILEEAEDGFAVEISPEQVDKADGDVIFYSSYGSTDGSGEDAAVGGPLWDTLGAVRDDRVHRVDDDLWFLGIGYTAANLILDEIEELLA
ncbi:ABC transporter substrate-binding protein [Streptomyces sp. 4N509B]|uniref:ABC transporter substrate-binding protein n=1 Tax=Streptomyces sp. 4N509B TaxID=3457413 RepID=UPI003FD484F7